MKNEILKELIYEFWEKPLEDVRERLVGLEFLDSDLVNDIVGLRRAGKTYFMYSMVKTLGTALGRRQFIYLNCEHRRIYPLKLEGLNYLVEFVHGENLLGSGRVFILLDEVQTVEGWEIFAKSVHDEFNGKIKVVVSGSVKNLLSEDYGRLLSGRHKTIGMFPLSFREYLKFGGVESERITEEKKAKIKAAAERYVRYGGIPKYVLTGDLEYLDETFRDIMDRDVKTRVEIRKKKVMDEMAALLLERNSSPVSFTKIRNIMRGKGHRISTDLVIRYASVLGDVFLFFFLPAFSVKYSGVIRNPKKVYVADNGFLGAFPLKISENLGKLMENAVFLELLRRGFRAEKDLFYYKTGDGKEVDFLIREGRSAKQLIQVCYDTGEAGTREREVNALVSSSGELGCENLLVITWDLESEEKTGGKKIVYVPLWKWLLGV